MPRRCETRGERIRQTEATETSERQVVLEEVRRSYVRRQEARNERSLLRHKR